MKCPWNAYHCSNGQGEEPTFDTIKQLDEHLQTHETWHVSRKLAELIAADMRLRSSIKTIIRRWIIPTHSYENYEQAIKDIEKLLNE